jgi:hypothetical protein
MYLYVEMWRARPAWFALATDERERFFGTVGQEIGSQIGAGCELVGIALNDADTPRRAPYDYLAVWRIPDRERLGAFAATWEWVGFHNYFEQLDVRGAETTPETFVGHMIGL